MIINNNKIYQELATRYNLPAWLVEDIVRSQFSFLAKTIEKGELKGMRLHHLGLFMVKPGRPEQLRKIWEKAMERKNEGVNKDI